MRKAIELLPPGLKAFFDNAQDEIVVRVIDPDTWRSMGWDEDPNHFVNFGVPEFGKYPFAELPRDYDKALEKFGLATLKRDGMLPWREEEEFGNLRRAFEGFARGQGYSGSSVIQFAPVMAHYIQDAFQPLHASDNYNGDKTGDPGVHARFESELVERFQDRLVLSPAAPKAIANARDFAFDTLIASNQLVDAIIQADKDAAAGKDVYDDGYYETFFNKVKPIIERRLSEAITATAGLIMGAWEQAGKPALTVAPVRPVQRIRR